jgi:hypothetical protein
MKNILDKKTRVLLDERIDKLQPDTPALWGTMNVSAMLAHMNDAIKIALGMKPAKDKSNWYFKHIVFNAALYLLPSWPKGNPTAAEMDQKRGGTPPRDFYTEKEFAKKMLDIFSERDYSKLHPHPMFGPLSKEQWADLLTKHWDHHLKQFGV